MTDHYALGSTLFENASTIIYKAKRLVDDSDVILKTHKRPEDMHKIKHEFDLLQGRHIKGISNVLDIINNNVDPIYLVSEDCGAVVLEDYLAAGPMPEEEFQQFAVRAANALSSVHKAKIIHRDIKPSNMLIDPDTLDVWYIDFGISVLAKPGADLWQESVTGTLEYMPPEQTGRINSSVDFRSDIYSLGVTMYQAITGRLPFIGKTAMDLIHAHIAVTPTPPIDIVPMEPIVSLGIMKMLEKKPEDRYQTADSIAYDTKRSIKVWGQGMDPSAFMLGEKDIFYNLEAGHKLYAKDDVLNKLKNVLDNAQDSRTELVFLDGPAASGKSALLEKFRRYATKKNALLFFAAYAEMSGVESFHSLRKAFDNFESQLYGSRISLSSYREKIMDALGSNAQVLTEILPSMEKVLGKLPPAPVLTPAESRLRQQQVFRTFMKIICNIPQPCVFIFDGIHWSYEDTLQLVFSSLENDSLPNCMMVFAFRDDQNETSRRLDKYIKRLNLRHNAITYLHVRPFGLRETQLIVQDTFPMDDENAGELAQVVYNQTEGNMRRMTDYLKSLYHNGAVTFKGLPAPGHWEWDRSSVGAEAFADIDAQAKDIYSKLSKETIFCVDMLSCLSLEPTKEQVEIVFGGSMSYTEIERALEPVLDMGYMHYNKESRAFSFDNNRIRNIAYSMIPESKRRTYHFTIGTRLYEAYECDARLLAENCGLITDQYNRFGDKDAPEKERSRIIGLNQLAGDEALKAANLEQAAHFYNVSLELLSAHGFDARHKQTFAITLNYASCLFALGQIEDAVELYRQLIVNAADEAARFEVFDELVKQYISIADWIGAEKYAKDYLAETGLLTDETDTTYAVLQPEQDLYVNRIDPLGVNHLLELEDCGDVAARHNGTMLATLAECQFMNMSPFAWFYLYRTMNFAMDHGVFPGFEKALALLAERNANMREFGRAKALFDCGIAWAEKHGAPQSILWAIYCTVIVHWVEPLANMMNVYQKAKHIALLEGDLAYGSFSDMMLLRYHIFCGTPLSQVMRDVEAALYNAEKSNFQHFNIVYTSTFRQFVRCMTGRTKGLDSFDDRNFIELLTIAKTDSRRWHFNAQFYYVYRIMALYINGFYEKAHEYAKKAISYLPDESHLSAVLCRVQFYYYHSLALIRLCEKDRGRREEFLPIIQQNQRWLSIYAKAQPDNFAPKYAFVETELHRMDHPDADLLTDYSDIDFSFAENGCTWDQGILEESLMAYWNRRGIGQYGDMHCENALRHYRKLGARVKVLQLTGERTPERQQEELHLSTTMPTITTALMNSVHSTSLSHLSSETAAAMSLDYQAVLNVISCLVSENNMQDLLDQLLSLLLRNGGADQALLFLVEDSNLNLRAFRYADKNTQGFLSQQMPLPLGDIPGNAVPHKVLELSAGKHLQVVANSSDNEYIFLNDPYLEARKPESFICLPVVSKAKLIGLIYLENAQLPGVFPPPRVHFLNTIVLQSSLLIENAMNLSELEKYTGDLEKRLNSYISQLNTLIAGIAHEINSPLGVCVTVATRLLQRSKEVTGIFEERQLSKSMFEEFLNESNDGLDILSANVGRASQLVQNFKKISVDQAGEVFEELDLMQTLRNIVEYVRPAVKKKVEGCTVSGPDELYCYTSNGALAQVFTNLIMNSGIHAFEGMEKADCKITIQVDQDEDNIRIVYTDNGRGMTAAEREQVFMPFFTTRRNDGGSGLGGHIILSLVTQTLKGHVQCISSPGHGTSYIIKLPKLKEEAKESAGNG